MQFSSEINFLKMLLYIPPTTAYHYSCNDHAHKKSKPCSSDVCSLSFLKLFLFNGESVIFQLTKPEALRHMCDKFFRETYWRFFALAARFNIKIENFICAKSIRWKQNNKWII